VTKPIPVTTTRLISAISYLARHDPKGGAARKVVKKPALPGTKSHP